MWVGEGIETAWYEGLVLLCAFSGSLSFVCRLCYLRQLTLLLPLSS
jgi:hypothetical protein